jgi:hypothetical protein
MISNLMSEMACKACPPFKACAAFEEFKCMGTLVVPHHINIFSFNPLKGINVAVHIITRNFNVIPFPSFIRAVNSHDMTSESAKGNFML